jgi:hypothetical protein
MEATSGDQATSSSYPNGFGVANAADMCADLVL